MRPLRELTLILLVLVGAVGVSQLPGFVAAYEQRLGGALDEAQRLLAQFTRDGAASGLSFSDYIAHLKRQPDAAVAATGATIEGLAARVAALAAEQAELSRAGKLTRPILLARQHDSDLLRAAWASYQPTLGLDLEFGAIGLILGWLLNALLWALLGPRRRYATR